MAGEKDACPCWESKPAIDLDTYWDIPEVSHYVMLFNHLDLALPGKDRGNRKCKNQKQSKDVSFSSVTSYSNAFSVSQVIRRRMIWYDLSKISVVYSVVYSVLYSVVYSVVYSKALCQYFPQETNINKNIRNFVSRHSIIPWAILTPQCRPRCNVWTFHSSHVAGLGLPYVHECI